MNENNNVKEKKSFKDKFFKYLPAILFGIVMLVVIIIVVVSSHYAKKEIEEYKIKDQKVYLFNAGGRIDFDGSLTLDRNNNITEYSLNEKDFEVVNYPIYFDGTAELLLPFTMSVVFPTSNMRQVKVNYYTKINAENIQAIATNNDLNYALSDCFLYDGKDLYLFIEDTRITFGENEIVVPALSWAEVAYRGDVVIFNYSEQEVTLYPDVSDNVIAYAKGYSINMSYDKISDGSMSLLLNQAVDQLKNLK